MSKERNTKIETVLFPIEQKTLYLAVGESQQTELFDLSGTATHYGAVEGYKAIVDVERNRVFSIVTNGYDLVTNQEALELGKECFREVFSQHTADGMTVFNIIMPSTRSFCHVDYVHEQSGFEPFENDKWTPYLRVTNSYNRMKPLRFDLGFCRWICANGMIFGDKSITFQYYHTRGAARKRSQFEKNFGDIKQLEKEFIEKLNNLKRYYVPKQHMLPLLCKAFDVRLTEEQAKQPKRADQLHKFKSQITELTEEYFNALGPNGYAALNVLTDFATRPSLYISNASMVDDLQKKCGTWTDRFLQSIEDKHFDFDHYLGDYQKTAELINAQSRATRQEN